MAFEIDWENVDRHKVSITLNGHATSFTLERPFLEILRHAAVKRAIAFAKLVDEVDTLRPPHVNLSAALRVYALELIKTQAGIK